MSQARAKLFVTYMSQWILVSILLFFYISAEVLKFRCLQKHSNVYNCN